jgi:protein NrfD
MDTQVFPPPQSSPASEGGRASSAATRHSPSPATAGEGRDGGAEQTYYGRQAVKPAPFDWRVGIYLSVSSVSGAAQLIAAVAQRVAPRSMRNVVRNGRYLAFVGAAGGPLLLIGDLKTPQRWYNMLRIFKRTSATSIGSYILSAFAAVSGMTALAETVRRRNRPLARALQVSETPAAIAGAGMLTYTGAMLSSTSTPLWAAEAPLLGARFAASGIAAGAAALSIAEQLSGNDHSARALDTLGLVATGTYAVISRTARERLHEAGVDAPLETSRAAPLHKAGATLSTTIPLVCHVLNALGGNRSRALSVIASISTLAGAVLTRSALLHAGKESAKSAADYLRYTRSDRAPGAQVGEARECHAELIR